MFLAFAMHPARQNHHNPCRARHFGPTVMIWIPGILSSTCSCENNCGPCLARGKPLDLIRLGRGPLFLAGPQPFPRLHRMYTAAHRFELARCMPTGAQSKERMAFVHEGVC